MRLRHRYGPWSDESFITHSGMPRTRWTRSCKRRDCAYTQSVNLATWMVPDKTWNRVQPTDDGCEPYWFYVVRHFADQAPR